MRRPSRQRVERAIIGDMEHGRRRLIEAVELDSGVMVVEYEVRHKVPDVAGVHVQFRVLIEMPNGTSHGVIRHSYFDKADIEAVAE